MCAHYESVHDKALLKKHFGVSLPSELARRDVWPGYLSTFIRRHENTDVGADVADEAVPTRIALANDEPMGVAGLWAKWRSPEGETVHSFTMLTIKADDHALMRNFHKPQDEKRMIVILPLDRYDDWLQASERESGEFLQAWPADGLTADGPGSSAQPGTPDAEHTTAPLF